MSEFKNKIVIVGLIFSVLFCVIGVIGQSYMNYVQIKKAQEIDYEQVLPKGTHAHADGRISLPDGTSFSSYEEAADYYLKLKETLTSDE